MKSSRFESNLMIPLTIMMMAASGCSSAQAPTATMSQAQLAISEAEQNRASQYAPLELSNARAKLHEAEQAMRNEDYRKARRLSEQALVDARLAEATAESEIARRDAAELQQAIKTLRAETERGWSR